jgi:hypothetical protein
MDEVFGYFPPHPANPLPKRPLLTLLKQARAQGVGVVLATQNPVDLDYKGLANMGTWMVGKLQTEQDKARLRDGLLGVGMEAATLERLLAATRKRVFLLHDVHRPAPVLLHSRWAMSYLRGPLTREETSRLMQGRAEPLAAAAAAAPAARPVAPAGLDQVYWGKYGGQQADPHLLVKFAVRYKAGGEAILIQAYPAADVPVTELLETDALAVSEQDLRDEAPAGVRHAEVPADLAAAGTRGIEKVLKERLPDKLAARVWVDPVTKGSSLPGEDREAFAARLQQAGGGAQEARLREKLEKKQRELQARSEDLQGRKTEKWAAVGSAILSNVGLILGKKRTISGAGTVLSKNRMENTAESKVEALQAEVAALQEELQAMAQVDPARFQETTVVPARGGVKVLRYALLWVY